MNEAMKSVLRRSFIGIILGLFFVLFCVGCDSWISFEIIGDEDTGEDTQLEDEDSLVFPDLSIHQSMVFYGDKALFIVPGKEDLLCDIYDIVSKEITISLSLPFEGYLLPHANASCLGSIFLSSGSAFPVLYVSAWNNQRQAFVYDISIQDGLYGADLIQVIDPSLVSCDLIGEGALDWVVDGDGGVLYSIAYGLKNSSTVIEGNCTRVTAFRLPPLIDHIVELHDSDVIDHFELPVINVFQDKFFSDGQIFVVSGMPNDRLSFPPKLFIINIKNKELYEYSIPLQGEPEGLCLYHGVKWLNMYGSSMVMNLDKLI